MNIIPIPLSTEFPAFVCFLPEVAVVCGVGKLVDVEFTAGVCVAFGVVVAVAA